MSEFIETETVQEGMERLYSMGLTDYQIAGRLRVAWKTVRKWREDNGKEPNPMREGSRRILDYGEMDRLYRLGYTDDEIAEMIHTTAQTVGKWRRDGGKKPNRPILKPENQTDGKAAPKPSAPRKKKHDISRCTSCIYWNPDFRCCDYLDIRQKRRPCPPGLLCTVRRAGKPVKRERVDILIT